MRPRRLEMTAFGPFAGTVAVDFGPLAEAGLFVITGPTGAGKTSLLDGISYALYGRVPGGRRADKLRSDHAPPDRATAVVLEFALAGEDWRVTRSPQHQRPKQRGTGTTTQKPTATLLRRVRDGDGGAERWEAVCSGVEEVSTTITQSLGLDAEQFAQVVVLPQGEVQRALQADAKDRERLLSSLFSTGRFSAVTARLAERARGLEDEVARGAERLDGVRAEVALRRREIAKELADLPAADRVAAAPVPGPGDPAPGAAAALDGTRDEVDPAAAVAVAEAAMAVVEAVTAAARERAAAAAAALRDGELLADRVRRRAAGGRRPARRGRPGRHRGPGARGGGDGGRPCRSALEADRDGAAGLAEARRAWSAAVGPLAAMAGPVAPLDPELAATITGWSAQDPPGPDEVDAARRALAGARGRLDQLLLRVASARRARPRPPRTTPGPRAWRPTRTAPTRRAPPRWPTSTACARRWRRPAPPASACPRRRPRPPACAAWPTPPPTCCCWRTPGRRRGAAVAATEAAQAAEAVHLDLWRRRLEGMAGVLAEHLEEGGPCPVCGATDHPDRADLFDGVTEDAIAEAERDAEAARREADAAGADRARVR